MSPLLLLSLISLPDSYVQSLLLMFRLGRKLIQAIFVYRSKHSIAHIDRCLRARLTLQLHTLTIDIAADA
jgi:hypothetical protein